MLELVQKCFWYFWLSNRSMSCTSTTVIKNNATTDSICIPVWHDSFTAGKLQDTAWYCSVLQFLEGYGPLKAVGFAKLRPTRHIFQAPKYSVSATGIFESPKVFYNNLFLNRFLSRLKYLL